MFSRSGYRRQASVRIYQLVSGLILVQVACVHHTWWWLEAKLAIVFTYFFVFSSFFYAFSFSPTSGILRKLIFFQPSYFGMTRRNIQKNKSFFYILEGFFTKEDFRAIFLLFTASVWSRSLDQPLVPGVFLLLSTPSAFHLLRGYSRR